MDVVLYLRYSSDKQTEQSIEGQRRVCIGFCDTMQYRIVGEYIDRATSGKNAANRSDFQRMIEESGRKLWGGVVVYKLDRFARNRYDSAIYKAKLKKNGVRVLSATEKITDTPEGIILESVLEGMAEFYSAELSQKVTRGMYESALKGNACGGYVSLGYRVENKKLVIDERTAPIVRRAFEMYAEGHSMAEICATFNAAGYRTAKGAKFNKNSFTYLFRNKKYIGVYEFMGVTIEGGVPPIIDRETFDAVQRKLDSNKKAPARGKAIVDYILSGKAFCGHCGKPLVGMASTSHTGRKYFYYACAGSRRGSGCEKSNIRKGKLEEAVIADTLELLTPDYIRQLARVAVGEAERARSDRSKEDAYKAEIAALDKSIAGIIKVAESGIFSPSLAERLAELEAAKQDAKEQLAAARCDVPAITAEQAEFFLTQMTTGDPDDDRFRGRLVDMLIRSVTVWNGEGDGDDAQTVAIAYNIIPAQNTPPKGGKDRGGIGCAFDLKKTSARGDI